MSTEQERFAWNAGYAPFPNQSEGWYPAATGLPSMGCDFKVLIVNDLVYLKSQALDEFVIEFSTFAEFLDYARDNGRRSCESDYEDRRGSGYKD